MLIFTSISIVWTGPIPSVFIFFYSFKEKFAYNLWPASFHHFLLFLADYFSQLLLRKLVKLLAAYCIHNKLGSLIYVQIDFLGSIHC